MCIRDRLHNKIEDLTSAYYAPGVRQYILNRQCLPATPLPTTNRATMTMDNYATLSGIHILFYTFLTFLVFSNFTVGFKLK